METMETVAEGGDVAEIVMAELSPLIARRQEQLVDRNSWPPMEYHVLLHLRAGVLGVNGVLDVVASLPPVPGWWPELSGLLEAE